MAPTNSTPPGWSYQPWSYTGHKSQFADKDVPQPDNAGKGFGDLYQAMSLYYMLAEYTNFKLFFCHF